MDPCTKELAAIATPMAGHRQLCFKRHLAKALELGVTEDGIRGNHHVNGAVGEVGGQLLSDFVQITALETKEIEK
jgi:alkylhydroperoxidase/carboxymuconolactone decarboxylase family protein YurZ